MFYFLAAFFTFYIQYKREKGLIALSISIIFLLIFFPLMVTISDELRLDSILIYMTLPLLLLSIVLIHVLWKILFNPEFIRALITNDSPLNLSYSPKKAVHMGEAYRLKKLSLRVEMESPVDRLFIKRLNKLPYLSMRRSVMAKLYCMIDRYYTVNEKYLKIRLTSFVMTLFIICITGYNSYPGIFDKTHGFISSFLIKLNFFMIFPALLSPCFIVVMLLNPIKINHLFPEGRSEHFCSSLIIWLLKPVIVVAWMAVGILIAKVLKDYIPDFTLAGVSFNYVGPDFSLILWALILIPVINTFMYYDEKPCSFITMLVFLAVLLALSLYSIFAVNQFYASTAMALAIVISNGFFIERLWRYWIKKDIVLLD